MRFELDTEVNALYIYFRSEAILPGGVDRTIELEEGINLDVDAEDRILGMEFVEAGDLYTYLEAHGGELDIPERIEDLKGLTPA
jgi:uncharacterized protein YuzE